MCIFSKQHVTPLNTHPHTTVPCRRPVTAREKSLFPKLFSSIKEQLASRDRCGIKEYLENEVQPVAFQQCYESIPCFVTYFSQTQMVLEIQNYEYRYRVLSAHTTRQASCQQTTRPLQRSFSRSPETGHFQKVAGLCGVCTCD